ncbi:MAG: arsenite methyltransferase [Anaerolineales bacterium]
MSDSPEQIRESVRQHYAQHALSSSSCCGDSGCDNSFYNPDLLIDLPQDISSFSLGCGDPLSQANIQPGQTVLDLGSGGGLDCFLAAKQVCASGRVIGVDMTPEMLERARASADRMGISNVEFHYGLLEELPVEDDSVDVIISNCVINLAADKNAVFKEAWRVLKPGGLFSVSDIVIQGELSEQLRQDMEAWSACVSGAIPAGEYIEKLQATGFSDIQVEPKGEFLEGLPFVPAGVPFSALIQARKPA